MSTKIPNKSKSHGLIFRFPMIFMSRIKAQKYIFCFVCRSAGHPLQLQINRHQVAAFNREKHHTEHPQITGHGWCYSVFENSGKMFSVALK